MFHFMVNEQLMMRLVEFAGGLFQVQLLFIYMQTQRPKARLLHRPWRNLLLFVHVLTDTWTQNSNKSQTCIRRLQGFYDWPVFPIVTPIILRLRLHSTLMLLLHISFTHIVHMCCRTAPSSSDTAQLKPLVSLTPWSCSTSRRSTIFPSASWRRHKATPWEKRERRTKRWGQMREGWGGAASRTGLQLMLCESFGLVTSFPFFLRFSPVSTRLFLTTEITSCFWLTARAKPSTQRI